MAVGGLLRQGRAAGCRPAARFKAGNDRARRYGRGDWRLEDDDGEWIDDGRRMVGSL